MYQRDGILGKVLEWFGTEWEHQPHLIRPKERNQWDEIDSSD